MSKDSVDKASNTMHKKLFDMVKAVKADYKTIIKLGGNAPAVPDRFETRVKVPRN